MAKVPGTKGTPIEYVRGIESRHNMSAGKRSLGLHSPLGSGHQLGRLNHCLGECAPESSDIGGSDLAGKGGRGGSLPASNESVSSRKGPAAMA